ncbi:AcrB/AcrD/AcrF family efflux transporter inner membrane protein [Myxococcus stipitatus DSM 14675]|uniref:AcrB/AcrD/AcrF family efflux transporter inner membrane protein n=1 Tax=Myxococcus stipitatus (strain DSM 14675 / JCM 12634 / Mx s8) TaxID=1278073 RepID=L7UFA3_MYXSD|nr:efflux RND transporter permease subunit [Myxococcus stipitatus]AGC46540.1 AcrB/AcrD/AcrF family efflux transporter inner membrane protein [Myxococcus stipitatus DSM 14675]
MSILKVSLRRPVTVLVLVVAMLFFGVRAAQDIKVDVLPEMNLPVVYIAHTFNGYTPAQMEGYFTKMYVNMMLFTNGIKGIETKNSQGLTLMKIAFYEGTDMGQAVAEINALSNRSQVFLPPGAPPPFIIRFDASSQPVGQLVFRSETKTNNQLQDIANFTARPFLISIPGLTTAPPFGGSPRTIEINIEPEKLRVHNLTPEQVVEAIARQNVTAPSGNVHIGDTTYLTPTNSTIRAVEDFGNIPLFKGSVANLYVRDIATVKDGADVATGYALVNGKRSVYLNVAKSGNASTVHVVQKLKESIPRIQSNLPDDVHISYEFDQSVYVVGALKGLMAEGILGAVLTGLMVLLFLRDGRSALIVIVTIPIAIISGVLFLKLFGQSINTMTLAGLALAVGVLVDESTVTIENIHQHLHRGKTVTVAVWDACREIAFSKLLILLCILSVFAPALTMGGIPGALFRPLALAIGCSMVISFLLSQSLVPVLASWMLKKQGAHPSGEGAIPPVGRVRRVVERLMPGRRWLVSVGIGALSLLAVVSLQRIGKDVLPRVDSRQLQLRLRAAEGSRIEKTEQVVHQAMGVIEEVVGADQVRISSAYVGQHPSSFAISPIYLYNAGPHEALLQVAFEGEVGDTDTLKDRLRHRMREVMPEVQVAFEPVEITERILGQGSLYPIEVRFSGMKKKVNEKYAGMLLERLRGIDSLRDQQVQQSLRYPALNVEVDRVRAAQLGVDMQDITRSLTASTSSSRYTSKNMWVEGMMGIAYDVQVQTPASALSSEQDLAQVPLLKNANRPVLGDVATITPGLAHGETHNLGTLAFASVTANVHGTDLARARREVQAAIKSLGELPKGVNVQLAGLSVVLDDTLDSLANGLGVAIVAVFLLLAASFQSFRLAIVVLTAVPAVVLGALGALLLTGSTLNLQSYMGIIMAVGVSISNGVLMVASAEQRRRAGVGALQAALEGVSLRVRPILMTTLAMLAGMLPMAVGHGEGGDQMAPLARAVLGGLSASTLVVLFVLPLAFAWAQDSVPTTSKSLDPSDVESEHHAMGAV